MNNKRSKKQAKRLGNAPLTRPLSSRGDFIEKRMTFEQVLATGAGTVIPLTAISSDQVRSNPASEWASFQARYQEFRVRAIRVSGRAINPVNTATIVHSVLYRGDYIANTAPGNAATVLSDEGSRTCTTNVNFVDTVTWDGLPNAQLWASTAVGINATNLFSWVCAQPATPVTTTATTYYALVAEWLVQLRGSQ